MEKEIKAKINAIKDEKDKVYRLSQTRKQFFDSATHELKTPLTAISAYAQILVDGTKDEVFKKRASERILLESNRLHSLVCNLLSVSQEKSKIENSEEEIFLNDLIEEIIGDFRKIIDEQGFRIYLELEKVKIRTIRDNLTRIIINLIDNGIKYSSDNKLHISLKQDKARIILSVTNKCEELPKEVLNNMFEPFVKFNYEDATIPSTGLGLYIAKEICAELTSILNDGSITFQLHITNKELELITL